MEKTKALKILRLARRHGADRELVCKLLTAANRQTQGGDAGCKAACAVITESDEMTPEVFSAAFASARRKVPARGSKSKGPGR